MISKKIENSRKTKDYIKTMFVAVSHGVCACVDEL